MYAHANGAQIVRTFSEKVSTDTAFSLELLRAIDGTIDLLNSFQNQYTLNTRTAGDLLPVLKACQDPEPIDPDGTIDNKLTAAISSADTLLKRLRIGLGVTPKLRLENHHQEGLVDAYNSAIESVGEFLEAVTELKAAVQDNDKYLTKRLGPFKTLDELFARFE